MNHPLQLGYLGNHCSRLRLRQMKVEQVRRACVTLAGRGDVGPSWGSGRPGESRSAGSGAPALPAEVLYVDPLSRELNEGRTSCFRRDTPLPIKHWRAQGLGAFGRARTPSFFRASCGRWSRIPYRRSRNRRRAEVGERREEGVRRKGKRPRVPGNGKGQAREARCASGAERGA
jgi:hypothetical protein